MVVCFACFPDVVRLSDDVRWCVVGVGQCGHFVCMVHGGICVGRCVMSQLRLCSVGYVERRKHLDIQEPDASLQFMPCHQINVGCFLKPNITTCRRNDSIGFIFRSVGNVMRDIIYIISVPVRFRFPVQHDQLQVQVTPAHRLQAQVTNDISFANNHITSSFASCDDLLNAFVKLDSFMGRGGFSGEDDNCEERDSKSS